MKSETDSRTVQVLLHRKMELVEDANANPLQTGQKGLENVVFKMCSGSSTSSGITQAIKWPDVINTFR